MPPPTPDPAQSRLRALTYRLTTTPATQLPALAARLPAHLAACQPLLLNGPSSSSSSPADGTAALLHALRTRASALLRDRSASARLAGVLLVRGLLGHGGPEMARVSGAEWTRALVSLAGRGADPPASRALAVVAVVRACEAARGVEGAVREWVTPNLAAFISACLACAAERSIVETVLRGMAALLPWHAGVFRPFITQVLKVLGGLVWIPRAMVESDEEGPKDVEPSVREAAMEVYVLLHGAATKAGGLEDRDAGLSKAVDEARIAIKGNLFTNPTEPQQKSKDGRRPFVAKSADDLCCFLDMIGAYISTPSSKPMSIPAGKIVQLILDISTASPSSIQHSANEAKRDQFALGLPQLQVSALDMATLLTKRLNKATLPVGHSILQAIANTLEMNPGNPDVRIAAYTTTSTLLPLIGPALTRSQTAPLHSLIRGCTLDITPPPSPASTNTTTISTTPAGTPRATAGPPSHPPPAQPTAPLRAASLACLAALLAHAPAPALAAQQRADLERAAVLARAPGALRAAALNPRPRAAGLLPVAARLAPAAAGGWGAAGLEAAVRPRVPPLLPWGDGGGGGGGGGGEGGARAAPGAGAGSWGALVHGGGRAGDEMEADGGDAEEEVAEPESKRRRVYGAWTGPAPETAPSAEWQAEGGAEAPDLMDALGGPEKDRAQTAGEVEVSESPGVADEPVAQTGNAVESKPAAGLHFPKFAAQARRDTAEDEDMGSDDDDGSDFEIPPLIPRRHFEDDSDEEEDGGPPLL
jgi:pre-rRNA-processing protein RIX1